MSTTTETILSLLKQGKLDPAGAAEFEHLSAKSFVDELRIDYPFVFQKRTIGHKHEIGIAREIIYEFRFRKRQKSLFHAVQLHPVLHQCFLVSFYDDALSEITWARRINVRPARDDGKQLVLTFGAGFKVDKTIDGWAIKPLLRRGLSLSEDLLQKRGFQFNALPPFGLS